MLGNCHTTQINQQRPPPRLRELPGDHVPDTSWSRLPRPLPRGGTTTCGRSGPIPQAGPSLHPGIRRCLRRAAHRPRTGPGAARRGGRGRPHCDAGHAVDGRRQCAHDDPAEHWIHPRTTTPIESAFATVRLRLRVTQGPGSRAAGIAMAFKLIESTQARRRAVNAAPHLVALVRACARCENARPVERPAASGGDQQAA